MDPVLVGFVIYLVVIFAVSLLTFRRNETVADFLIADRKLGPWLVAFSERASGESAWLLLGLPGVALAAGLGDFWVVVGCVSGIAFSWLFIARRLRRETERYGALTLPEYFESKFQLPPNLLRLTSTLIITFFFTYYIAAQFNAAGKVLNTSFGIPQFWGMVTGAVIILFYTMMGGFLAVVWTDFFQGLIMILTLVLLPIVGIMELGGVEKFTAALSSLDPQLLSIFSGKSGFLALFLVLNGLSWGLGYMGQPHLVTRFMAIRREEDLRRGFAIAMAWAIPAFVGAYFIGLAGWAYIGGDLTIIGGDQDKIMPYLARALLHPALAGVLISGAIAAMMSTADSQLLVTTSAVAEDVVHRMINPALEQKSLVLITRLTTLAVVFWLLSWRSNPRPWCFAWSGTLGPAWALPSDRRCC